MTDQLKTPFERVTGPELLRQGMDVDAFCGLLVSHLAGEVHSALDASGVHVDDDDYAFLDELRDKEVEAAMSEATHAAVQLCKAAMRLEASGVEDLNALDVLHGFGGERYRKSAECWFDLVPRRQLKHEREQRMRLQKRLKTAQAKLKAAG